MLSNAIALAKRFLQDAGGDHGRFLRQMRMFWRGYTKWHSYTHWPDYSEPTDSPNLSNPLRAFFEARTEGPGIWKWNHYFDIYDRHFSRFRGQDVRVLEIGIYSGGSLEMWRDYFGPRSQIYGVDIQPACKAYESDFVKVFIGDQADRNFWKHFKNEAQPIDIVIDDGGHLPEQQIVTFEELLPHLRPGGVYLCEDVQGTFNSFASYVYGFAQNLNACEQGLADLGNNERRAVCKAIPVQSAVRSIHLYPYVTAIERTVRPISEFIAPKHGTQWEPFLN
jgi:hypothetical protein